VPRISREYERFAVARTRKQQITAAIQACIDSGDLPRSVKPLVAIRVVMAGLLGIAAMRLSERLAPGENADDLAADALDVALAGLRSGITLRSAAEATACPLDEPMTTEQAS